jgi:transcriptional regulator with XRE-family HTH domain
MDNERLDVKAIRDRLGLSQRELAELIGVNHGTINGWESGRRDPNRARAATRERLEELRDTRPEDLPPPRSDEPEAEDAAPASVARAKKAEQEVLPVLSLERRIALMYEWIAAGSTWLAPQDPKLQRSAAVVKRNAPLAAKAWVQWGAENPRVQRFLEMVSGPGAAGQVIVVHFLILGEIWAIVQEPPAQARPVAPPQPPQPSPDGRAEPPPAAAEPPPAQQAA